MQKTSGTRRPLAAACMQAILGCCLPAGHTYIAQRLQQVDDFMRQRKVPGAMAERVHNYYNYILRRQVSSEQSFIMEGRRS